MKQKLFLLLVIFLTTGISSIVAQENQDYKVLFEKAMYTMETKADLNEAITLFESLIKTYPNEKEYVAKALFYVGMCYEKLGNLKARQYYEKVINNYGDQSEMVQLAQIRLNRILKTEKPANEELSVINLYEKGSWMENSSLSPDGTKIAGIDYSIGQNISVYDRLTDKTQMITKYKWTSEPFGITYYPVWSPDGKEIVYMFTDTPGIWELQVSTLQGKTRTLIKNEHNEEKMIPKQWSQDGNNILIFKQDSIGFYTIGLVAAKSGSFKALHKTQWKDRVIKGDASLSPDGKFVVFADGQKENLDLFIIETEGGTTTVLSDHPTNESEPLWSPDGKHIVFIRETKGGSLLYGIEMAEGKPVGQPFLIKEGMQDVDLINWTEHGINYDLVLDLRDIYSLPLNPETGIPAGVPKPINYTPTGSNICPVWSHDSKYLAFISYDDKPEVVILPTNGMEARHYTISISEFWAPGVQDLRWLPDNSGVGFTNGNSLGVFTANRLNLTTGKWQDWTLPVKGWTRTEWGPDENSFVYNDKSKPKRGLYQFNFKTGETQNIFQPEDSTWYTIRGLKFSRDHKKLTFMFQNTEQKSDLMVVDVDSGKNQVLSQEFRSPAFSPDGKKILAFGKKYSVAILSLDGEILQQYDLSKHFTSGTRISSPDWSPDGKQLVFSTVYWKTETYLLKNVLK